MKILGITHKSKGKVFRVVTCQEMVWEKKSSSRSGKVTEFYCRSGKMKALNIEPGIMLK